MKQKIIWGQFLLIIVLFLLLLMIVTNTNGIGSLIIRKLDATDLVYLDYGDQFAGVEMVDTEGEIAELHTHEKYTVVTYLSSSCSSCIKVLADFNRFSYVFGDSLEYRILWLDEIPFAYVDKYSVDRSINFSLSGKVKISTSTPTFYILDENGKVVFRDISRENLITKLINLQLVPIDTLIVNANEYICKNLYKANSVKDKLIYFYMPGCPDCEAANSVLSEIKLEDQFDIKYVYKYDTTDSSKVIDYDKLFASIYDITWYPSFLVLSDNGYRIIGKMPIDEIIDEIIR